uniref:N-acetyltransferase domain-containing protein n=1 Tax=Leptobrachium leishanense TaxID=445787 RepID=A0A8C5PCM1_9ANUR
MTAPSAPEIQILPATASDYDGVLAISEGIYNGVDYLPFTYHACLTDPQRRMFIAKSEGKVVAFESFLLVDGGVTAVVQSLRVASWMRGRGVAGIITQYLLDTLRSDHPDVTRIRFSKEENPPASILKNYRIIHSKAVVSVFLSADELAEALRVLELQNPSACKDSPPPVFLNNSEVHSLFSGPLQEEYLLPGRFLIQSGLPITTCKANLDLLQRSGVQWLCSYPCDAMRRIAGSSDLFDVSTNGSSSKEDNISVSGRDPSSSAFKGFLSLGTPMFPVPLGVGKHRLNIDMFGTDLSCATIHVLLQLKAAVKALPTGGSIICFLYAEESLRDGLTGLLDGFTPFFWRRDWEQLVLENHSKQ